MSSKAGNVDKVDLKRWGMLVLVGAIAGAINAVAGQVIPELEEVGGAVSGAIVLGLTFAIDFVRRFLSDTRVVEKEEVDKLVVKEDGEKVSLLNWIMRR